MKAAGWTWAQLKETAHNPVRGVVGYYQFGDHGFDSHKRL